MSDLKVTPEGMPAIVLGGVRYPLFFSVYGVQRWAEYKGVDFHEALGAGWGGKDGAFSDADLTKLLEIALASGEARRVAFGGGEARTIGADTVSQICELYSVIEVASVVSEAWNLLPEGEPSPNPEAPRE